MVIFHSYFDITRGYNSIFPMDFVKSQLPACGPATPRSPVNSSGESGRGFRLSSKMKTCRFQGLGPISFLGKKESGERTSERKNRGWIFSVSERTWCLSLMTTDQQPLFSWWLVFQFRCNILHWRLAGWPWGNHFWWLWVLGSIFETRSFWITSLSCVENTVVWG